MSKEAILRRLFPALLAAAALAAPASAATVTLPKGTVIQVKVVSGFSSDTLKKGDRVLTVVYPAVFVGTQQAVPRAAVVWAEAKHVRTPKDGAKSAAVALKFEEMKIGDKTWNIEGVLTSLQRDDSKKILEHEAKRATGRKLDVVIIGAGTEASKRASMLVGTSGEDREDLADEWAASGLGPGFVVVAPDTVLAFRLEKPLTVEESHGRPPEDPDRVILVSDDAVKAAQKALAAAGAYKGPITGTLDEPTRRAIASYQIDHNVPATGDLDRETVQFLTGPARPRAAPSPAGR